MSARAPAIGTALRLAKAHDLVRRGHHKAARALVAPDGRPPENDTELHALAAIATHAGDYTEALSLWQLLRQRQPRHPEAARMIAAIECWQTRPSWYRYVPASAAALAGLLLCVILYVSLSSTPTRPAAINATSPRTAPAPAGNPALAPAQLTEPPAIRLPAATSHPKNKPRATP
ncbi:MAG: hypothetical protein HZA31_09965 [Opitutae bacterium]|nr:hypothetical protein [Opitutae bacterium]